MPLPCKVCESEYKELIESMILNGESNNAIANDMQAKGFSISQASVNRHKAKHMLEHKEAIEELATPKFNTKYDRNNDENYIDAKAIYEEIKTQATNLQSYGDMAENYNMLNIMLFRIVNNQMAITIDLQEKYMSGKTKYPHEQIRGLQIVQDMLQKLELFSKDMFKHKLAIVEYGNSDKYIFDKGAKAKLNMPEYVKGAIFKLIVKHKDATLGIIEYKKIYIPQNPYNDGYGGMNSFNEFDKGIESATGYNEKNDYLIAQTVQSYEEYDFVVSLLEVLKKGEYDYDEIEKQIESFYETVENETD